MNKKLSSGAQKIFLSLACLAGGMGGTFLCVMTALLGKNLLPGWLELVYALLGGLLSLVFLTIYFCLGSSFGETALGKIKSHWLEVLEAELWLLAIYYLWRLMDGIWNQVCASYLLHDAARIGAGVLLWLGAVFAASVFLRRLLKKYGPGGIGTGVRSILLAFGTLAASLAALKAADLLWNLFAGLFAPTAAGVFAACLFRICCAYGLVWVVLYVLCEGVAEAVAPESYMAGSPVAGSYMAGTPVAGSYMAGSPVTGSYMAGSPVTGSYTAGSPATGSYMAGSPVTGSYTAGSPVTGSYTAGAPFMASSLVVPPAVAPEQAARPWIRRLIGTGVPLLTVSVLILVTGGELFTPSAVERAISVVETPVSAGYASLELGNLEEALRHFECAEGRVLAFKSLASDEAAESMSSIYAEYPKDAVIGALYLSETDDVEKIENAVRNYSLGMEWYPVLLRYYDGEEKLAQLQKDLRDEMLLRCVSAGQYRAGDSVFTRDLRGKKVELRQELREYEEVLGMCEVLRLVIRYGAAGGYTAEMAYRALDLAEANPENLLMQYAACQVASNFREDDARHYKRTVEAAARFDKLYDDDQRTDAQVAAAKRFLGDVAAGCNDYAAALVYYQAAYALTRDAGAALSCAKAYDKLGDYEQCAQMADGVLGKEPDNTQALYLKAISALKTKDVDGALAAAGKLGDIIATPGRAVSLAEENQLYLCAQYLSMRDDTRWTDYSWKVYDSLSQEQIAAVQSHALLWDYMTGIYQCFMKKDAQAAEQAVEKILAVREDLPMAWYLRGTVAFNQKEFSKALSYFEKAADCGSDAPAIYFSIANVYDALEDYESAWAYSKRVKEIMPYQDHGSDVYGISYHNNRLLNALNGKLGR